VTPGPVVVDLRALQTPGATGGDVARYAYDFVTALERFRPDLVGRYLLAPDRLSPEDIGELLATGKAAYGGTNGAIPDGARVYHSLSVLDLGTPTSAIWPPLVEHLGLAYSASVHELTELRHPSQHVADPRRRLRYLRRCEVLRLADALLAVSPTSRQDLIDLVGVDEAAITVVGNGDPWEDVVERAAAVFERLASRGRQPWRRERRVAIVSPFPPIASGVARYSSRLAEAFKAELDVVAPGTALHCFADGLNRLPAASAVPTLTGDRANAAEAEAPAGLVPARPRPPGDGDVFDARQFIQVELAVGGYERVVYVLGNSEYHSGALAALRRRSGTVMAHDVRVSNLLRHSSRLRGTMPGGLKRAIRRAYGDVLPDGLGRIDSISEEDLERLGLLLLRDIAPHADRLLVSSEAARRLAETDVGPELAGRLGVLPFAMALDADELATVAAARRHRRAGDRLLVASFGIVDPIKLPHLLVSAVAALGERTGAELALVGSVSDALVNQLSSQASELGIADRCCVTGHVQRSEYLEHLGRTTVALQLRADFAGEASAAVGDCLAAGVPTIVSNVGWMAELPDDTVVKLGASPHSPGVAELTHELGALLDDPDRRQALSERAAAYAADHTFARTAAALVAALDLSTGEPVGADNQHSGDSRGSADGASQLDPRQAR
jgi:glycosyltransferase involved in cell wall biosynthesis